jgi:hypothetical protein
MMQQHVNVPTTKPPMLLSVQRLKQMQHVRKKNHSLSARPHGLADG